MASKEEAPLGLLDQPVLLEGKRKRTVSQLYNVAETSKKKKTLEQHVGSGTKLQNIPSVEVMISQRCRIDDLRMLYQICFGVNGKSNAVKKDLKDFQGFGFNKSSDQYSKKRKVLAQYSKSGLVSQFCTPLCLQRTGSKDELIDRILDFLLNPSDAGLVKPAAAKKTPKPRESKKPQKSKRTKSKEESVESKSQEESKSTEPETTSESVEESKNEEKSSPDVSTADDAAAEE
ncbi:protein DEK-like [Dysidea avara]|uniref:protein DEK-like n=1 Tax=Dysidea avara TaxID=196820 RepID=UPI003317ED82